MRTTIDIDDDLLAAAQEQARRAGRTAGGVVSRLLRRSPTGQDAPATPAGTTTAQAMDWLAAHAEQGWDSCPITRNPGRRRWDHVLGSRRITDVCLLALAVQNQGTFVALDRSIAPASVPGARKEHLTVLGAAP